MLCFNDVLNTLYIRIYVGYSIDLITVSNKLVMYKPS